MDGQMYPLWETGELGLENKATQQPLAKPAWQHLRHSSLGFLGDVVAPGIDRQDLPATPLPGLQKPVGRDHRRHR